MNRAYGITDARAILRAAALAGRRLDGAALDQALDELAAKLEQPRDSLSIARLRWRELRAEYAKTGHNPTRRSVANLIAQELNVAGYKIDAGYVLRHGMQD